jgi:FAD/FMN-containing dehydrogenase
LHIKRRHINQFLLGSIALGARSTYVASPLRVSDVSQLNSTVVAGILQPKTSAEIATYLAQSRGRISIGGSRYSAGGQIVAQGSTHIDMRAFNRLIWLNKTPAGETKANVVAHVRVQAGMRWRDLQQLIDPHDLSVAIMQSYSNFSIGGSVSVNCHGRYVGRGALIHSIRALQLICADGALIELNRKQNADLFYAVIGGYGGLGVVSEVELDLAANVAIKRHAVAMALHAYPDYFRTKVLADPKALLHNADLMPPSFDLPIAATWYETDATLTENLRLVPQDQAYHTDQALIWAASELPIDGYVQEHRQAELLEHTPVVMRNFEASLDARSLEPPSRYFSTYLLQEYFIPVAAFFDFHQALCAIIKRNAINLLNVSIRHAPSDSQSTLSWARSEVFSFVLYYKQRNSDAADLSAQRWTRGLIDAALKLGGTYYLPYRLHASLEQFERAYPGVHQFRAIKARIDPSGRFGNALWDRYL